MKRKRFSALLGVILTLAIIAGITLPLADASEVTIEFLNPLGRIEPQNNQPLAERTPWKLDEDGHLMEKKTILVLTYGNSYASTALGMMLIDEYGKYGQYYDEAGIILVQSPLSGNWGPKTEANYNVNWVNPTGGTGSPNYVVAGATGYPADFNQKYSSGTGAYSGKIDIAIMGVAD